MQIDANAITLRKTNRRRKKLRPTKQKRRRENL